MFSIFAAEKVGRDGHVYSFESDAKAFNQLTINKDSNKFDYQMHAFNFGLHGSQAENSVVVKTFDIFASEMNIRHIDLLKIDTREALHDTLEGMQRTFLEIGPRALIVEIESDAPLVSWINERGYESKILEKTDPERGLVNMLFVKP